MNQTGKKILNRFFEGIPGQGDVLLLVSPLVMTKTVLLSLHVLQAACRDAGITARVLYSNLPYSILLDGKTHNTLSRLCHLLFGERLFASAAFNRSAVAERMNKFLNPSWIPDFAWKINPDMAKQVPGVLTPFREWLDSVDWEQLESLTTQWIQAAAQRITQMRYPLVGCSTTFGGLVPAIALLNSIKKANPNTITILGGTLCEEQMAEGILSLDASIDYIFSGESESTFPAFVKKVLVGHLPKERIIYEEPVTNLDTLSPPDYQDYLDQLKQLPPPERPSPGSVELPYETSRGCWFGKCTFCSFNGKKNFYREKSPEKVIDDLKKITARHGIHTILMVDNIMPRHYFDTLLPRIPEELPDLKIRYEIKANLTLKQVQTLKKAGVISIEPGIESLSSSMLKRMRKGVTVRENIALLRYARSVNLEVLWNLVFDLPGDRLEEYQEILQLLPLLRHLPPPRYMSPLMIFRFSAFQMSPQTFGISNLRPPDVYQDIFPSHAHLEKITYYFSGDFRTQSHEHPEIIVALAKEIQAWKDSLAAYKMIPLDIMLPRLHISRKSDHEYVLEDTRGLPGRPKKQVINREQASILLVPRPQDSPVDYQWAVDAQLGLLKESWFIPLATADPELLSEFEQDYGNAIKVQKK
ncbi:MAG: RiPP maturation radical SAM protein 1 [Candidatus Aminicenantes bacterium]|nr:RiPP maturation radical SAM protein 1 [Candidatus Aminicenantes bacterium]NIM77288.1 RiPP maturation radical SAM protein 1 [Candidatus Aminicenantes bacterium]NIN16589.1 RiPP maturation radical SAM protein 1 [Candidatus Aminicenantes bacterium]NIN40447.1 RiPP maturation radical SAM protein 1 [Candidatus Aminicenantes bacterium]NIN83267.1 RiPP maturation radical SAM protein 1 [Candidatus Aminicenantes bacterium]